MRHWQDKAIFGNYKLYGIAKGFLNRTARIYINVNGVEWIYILFI